MLSETTAFPSLTTLGWVTSLEHKADQVFAYFIASQYSQSVLYHGMISSLPHLLELYGNKPDELRRQVTDALNSFLGKHFQQVDTGVEVLAGNDAARYKLRIHCTIDENGKSYSLGRLISILDSKVTQVTVSNQTGIE